MCSIISTPGRERNLTIPKGTYQWYIQTWMIISYPFSVNKNCLNSRLGSLTYLFISTAEKMKIPVIKWKFPTYHEEVIVRLSSFKTTFRIRLWTFSKNSSSFLQHNINNDGQYLNWLSIEASFNTLTFSGLEYRRCSPTPKVFNNHFVSSCKY